VQFFNSAQHRIRVPEIDFHDAIRVYTVLIPITMGSIVENEWLDSGFHCGNRRFNFIPEGRESTWCAEHRLLLKKFQFIHKALLWQGESETRYHKSDPR